MDNSIIRLIAQNENLNIKKIIDSKTINVKNNFVNCILISPMYNSSLEYFVLILKNNT